MEIRRAKPLELEQLDWWQLWSPVQAHTPPSMPTVHSEPTVFADGAPGLCCLRQVKLIAGKRAPGSNLTVWKVDKGADTPFLLGAHLVGKV